MCSRDIGVALAATRVCDNARNMRGGLHIVNPVRLARGDEPDGAATAQSNQRHRRLGRASPFSASAVLWCGMAQADGDRGLAACGLGRSPAAHCSARPLSIDRSDRARILRSCASRLTQVLLFSALGVDPVLHARPRRRPVVGRSLRRLGSRARFRSGSDYVRRSTSMRWLVTAFRVAYASLIPQIIMLVFALGFTARLEKLRGGDAGRDPVRHDLRPRLAPSFPAISNSVALGLTVGATSAMSILGAAIIHLADFNGASRRHVERARPCQGCRASSPSRAIMPAFRR